MGKGRKSASKKALRLQERSLRNHRPRKNKYESQSVAPDDPTTERKPRCANKVDYPNLDAAKAMARHYNQTAYECTVCGLWHLTSRGHTGTVVR